MQISIIAKGIMLTEMHHLFFIIGQLDVYTCQFCTAELLLTLISHSVEFYLYPTVSIA